jgi:hypothetical protein
MSFLSRVLANSRSRNLVIVACISAIALVWYLNRDDGEDVYVGKVSSIHYYKPHKYGGGGFTAVWWNYSLEVGTMNFCGDQEGRFLVGHGYRVVAKTSVVRNNGGADDCQRVLYMEDLGDRAEADHISGRIASAVPRRLFLSNMLGKLVYTFNLEVEDSNQSKHSVTLCDDNFGPKDIEAYRVLQDLQGNPDWSTVTVFYNGAAKSQRYGCYPLLTVRNEKTGLWLTSRSIPMFYSDRDEINRQFGVPVSKAQDVSPEQAAPALIVVPASTPEARLPSEILRSCKTDSRVPTVMAMLDGADPDEIALHDCGGPDLFITIRQNERNRVCSLDFTGSYVENGFKISVEATGKVIISTSLLPGSNGESQPWTVELTQSHGILSATSADESSPKVECETQ